MAEPSTPIPSRGIEREVEEVSDAENETEIPLTMAASVVLGSLPRDAKEALREAGRVRDERGRVGVGKC